MSYASRSHPEPEERRLPLEDRPPNLQPDMASEPEPVVQPDAQPPQHPYDGLKKDMARLGEVLMESLKLYTALGQSIAENKGPILLDSEARAMLSRIRVVKSRAGVVEARVHALRHPKI